MNRPLNQTTVYLMIGTAIFFDILGLVNLIPFVGQILSFFVSLFEWMTFWLWFKMYGVSFTKGKNLKNIGIGIAIETIPVINTLPGCTFTVIRLIATKKLEDAAKNTPVASKVIQMKNKEIPLKKVA